ncbi:hypothetical protein ED733_002267 [Metarhizium rileyi]|uniref:Cytochrome P450 n=1 Tax=Metarhizium rileyi (strain RCEF 4871) TaxID=1649241 RepID=A0A5C6GJ67_METRR|nr:hypothetical protein ED733_002267 [Metarhizium rileyi]
MTLSPSLDLAAQEAFLSLDVYTSTFILVCATLFLLRILAMPKPLPGIPYDPESAKRILGDLPGFAGASNEREWVLSHGMKLQSPIFQIFLKPFQKPFVFVTDFYEMAEISMRRTKEFDRSYLTIGMLEGIIPEQLVTLHSHDPKYKKNKELVSAPHIYAAVLRTIGLWDKKLDLCGGQPFEAGEDVHHAALDMIVVSAFGLDVEKTHLVKKHSFLRPGSVPDKNEKHMNQVFEFEDVPLDPELGALTTLAESTRYALRSPFPRLLHWYNRNFSPTMKGAQSLVREMRHREIAASIKRRDDGQTEWCALDHMIARETAIAEKEGRQANFHTQAIASELLGYLIGGHETTSAAIRWGIKFLTDDQRCQSSLRNALRAAYPAAVSENRLPSLSEILKTHVPYLDAVVEENLRCGKVLSMTLRDALVDTEVLGMTIPKGTSVGIVSIGPGMTTASTTIPFDENKYTRGPAAKEYMQKYGRFDDVGIETYYPERWLKATTDDKGREVTDFDANAGPILAFGKGPRACFGRKLAYLEMRIFFTLVFLKYTFDGIPRELAGHEETVYLTRAPTNVFVKLGQV